MITTSPSSSSSASNLLRVSSPCPQLSLIRSVLSSRALAVTRQCPQTGYRSWTRLGSGAGFWSDARQILECVAQGNAKEGVGWWQKQQQQQLWLRLARRASEERRG